MGRIFRRSSNWRHVGLRCSGKALLIVSALAAMLGAPAARAFPLVVQPGDTLAGIAQRVYGRVEYEGLLVSANGLEPHGGIAITPGMRLEVPALAYRRVAPGDTWVGLATALLGSAARAPVLAFANDG